MGNRPTWDETWLAVSDVMAKRSRCSKAQVGAVIVTADNKVNSSCYNGPVGSVELVGTCDNWCPRAQSGTKSTDYSSCPGIHAESNSLIRADHSAIRGGTMYVSRAMCINCAKEACNSGIGRIVQLVTQEDLHRNIADVAAFIESTGVRLITIMRCTACDLTWQSMRLDVIEKHQGHVERPLRSLIG
jgi:dCMP deaminase